MMAWMILALLQDFEGVAWDGPAPDLKGKVAMVRWWTSGCELCESSTPALREIAKKVPVVAIFHPKPKRDVEPSAVRAAAKAVGMPGTVGVDRDWKVLERWKAGKVYAFTSLTFLLDRQGMVRYVHPGGSITAEEGGELGRRIDALLADE